MDVKQSLNKLMSKDMDRREFLTHIGAAALVLVGISGLVEALNDFSGSKNPKPKNSQGAGYGKSSYGG